MSDQITTIGQSLVQHGKHSDRVYLMKLHPDDAETIIPKLLYLANIHQYGKIFCKVPAFAKDLFSKAYFIAEAEIPQFYKGTDNVYFYSLFPRQERSLLDQEVKREIEDCLKKALKYQNTFESSSSVNVNIRKLSMKDMSDLARLYQTVFPSYPFPIHDQDYLVRTMQSHVDYFGIWENDLLIAASSAEKDEKALNAEMTDFATLPDHRGKGCSAELLHHMEKHLQESQFQTAFTIARAHSPGMNITFAKLGYAYGGLLINNTQISGRIESMHVWYKNLGKI